MCAAPARVAGVAELVLCVPPGPDGAVAAETLAAAAIAGIDEVYCVGGAQAVAAMAFGTESIRPVDVIAGPGNRYVAEAKRQVSGMVGVPSAFAGPSEVVVVADDATPVAWAAIDVVVQAEHGPDGLAWLVTWSPEAADAIEAEVDRIVAASPRRADLEATLRTRRVRRPGGRARPRPWRSPTRWPPSTSSCSWTSAEDLLPLVRCAGAVFLGPYAPASVGDYLAGPNHVLPTARTARFASALRVDDFRTHIHAVSMDADALARLAPHVVAIAEAEGLPAHARSVLCAGRVVTGGPVPLRPDLTELSGYHSPQVDVEVRLNTNESPLPPPPRVARRAARPSWAASTSTAIPTATPPSLRAALGALHHVDPDRVFCANGSNEVLQCLLLAYGGPGRTVARVRAHVRAAQPHRLAHRHGGGARLARHRPPRGPRRRRRRARAVEPGHHVPVLSQQPHRARRAARDGGPRPGARPGPGGGGRGLRAVRPLERARPRGRGRAGCRTGWW